MKNNHGLISPFLIIFLFLTTAATAQLELHASQVTINAEEQVQIDITVADFTEIVGLQFALEWDSTVIDLAGISNLGLPQLTPENININQAGSGLITMAWLDNSLAGVDLPDSSVIFSINYDVVGVAGDTSSIEFTSNDGMTVIEAINTTEEVDVVLFPGQVIIADEINSIEEISQNIFSVQPNFPNPFRESTIISANFAEPTVATLHIFDSDGKGIYTHQQRYSAGEHSIFITQDLFPQAGIYWYQLQTMTHSIAKPLLVIK